jgi:hypothetical protein
MKIKLSLLLCIIVLLCTACAAPKTEEPWEGITGNTLKVTISEFFPFEENETDESIKIRINEKLNQRASLIIASHITINLDRNKITGNLDVTINKLINEAVTGGRMTGFECNENNYCDAHGEYDITELQENLEFINKQ